MHRDLALKLFREDVITQEKVQSRLMCQILDEIHKERCGEAIDRQLLRTVIRMLVDLKVSLDYLSFTVYNVTRIAVYDPVGYGFNKNTS